MCTLSTTNILLFSEFVYILDIYECILYVRTDVAVDGRLEWNALVSSTEKQHNLPGVGNKGLVENELN